MAEVPAWVLIVNTIAAGGFGLSGSFLMPRGQREALRQERTRVDAAIMRERATDIFKLLVSIEAQAAQAAINYVSKIANLDASLKVEHVGGYEDLRALVAVYYPSGLPILERYDAVRAANSGEMTHRLSQASNKADAQKLSTIQAVGTETLFKLWITTGEMAKELRVHMIDAVKIYVPSGK